MASTQAQKAAKARQTKKSIGTKLKLSNGKRPVSGQSVSVSGCNVKSLSSSQGNGSGPNGYQRVYPNNEYLAFVAQNSYGQWRYVRVNQNSLDLFGTPYLFHPSNAEEMLEIWKRVVIDNAIPFDETCLNQTLKIIRYKMETVDLTEELIEKSGEREALMKRSAVSKLTDAEAKMLGLENLKAQQLIFHNPDFDQDDVRTLKALHREMAEFAIEHSLEF